MQDIKFAMCRVTNLRGAGGFKKCGVREVFKKCGVREVSKSVGCGRFSKGVGCGRFQKVWATVEKNAGSTRLKKCRAQEVDSAWCWRVKTLKGVGWSKNLGYRLSGKWRVH